MSDESSSQSDLYSITEPRRGQRALQHGRPQTPPTSTFNAPPGLPGISYKDVPAASFDGVLLLDGLG